MLLQNKLKLDHALVLLMAIVLSACAPVIKKTASKPVVAKKTVVSKVFVAKPVKPKVRKEPKSHPHPQPQQVLVLLSSEAGPYKSLAEQLSQALGEYASQVVLTGKLLQDKLIINEVRASEAKQIVAIGLVAANAVKDLENKQVVFTHVVNYADNELVTSVSKGVSALPSPELLFKDWRALSPKLSKVAIISGKNLGDYLNRAKKAARQQGIELQIEQVETDKEFIYRSKSLKSVDGQWILPDNRVLSAKSLKEVMAYGSRRGRQIVVFSPKLLSFGGLFYVQPDQVEISKVVLKRLSEAAGKMSIPGDGVLPVLSHTMGINQNIARQFNLPIPEKYRKNINGE